MKKKEINTSLDLSEDLKDLLQLREQSFNLNLPYGINNLIDYVTEAALVVCDRCGVCRECGQDIGSCSHKRMVYH